MKSCHIRSQDAAWKICAAAMLCVAAGASAQSVHREVDIDGRITFTDRTETMALPQATMAQGADVASVLAGRSPMTSMEAANVDFKEATRRLVRARQSREEGMGPRPGESADSAAIRKMNENYLQDRQRLDREVAAAQRRSNKTSLDRSALLRGDDRTDLRELAQH
jgi:hypothetical protein